MSEVKELLDEAMEIIRNAFGAWKSNEIDQTQYEEVRNNTMLDVGYQLEIIPQPNDEEL